MMNWAAWGPTIVSGIFAVFSAGVLFSKVNDHSSTLTLHATEIENLRDKQTATDLKVAVLEAWRDGYNAATQKRSGE